MKSLAQHLKESKKGQVNSIGPAIIALVIAGVFLILGLIILEKLRDTDVVDGGGANINSTTFVQTNKTLVGLATFGDFWEIIVLAIVISVVIGLLLIVFGGRRQR